MGRILSIAFFVLVAEAWQTYLYFVIAAEDLAKIGLVGPLAGALVGTATAWFLEQLWLRLPHLMRSVLFVSIVVLFISVGTTYYQCYAEQITYDARVLHPQAGFAASAWRDEPWMMYPGLNHPGFGTGCQRLVPHLWASLERTLERSFVWLPVVILISWLTTMNTAAPRDPDVRDALLA